MYNADLTVNATTGGAVRVVISSNIGQGNAGVSLPCREVLVSQTACSDGTAGPIMMNIGAAATSILGVCLPGPANGTTLTVVISTAITPAPLKVPIDNISNLYFWSGTDGEIVDILYLA